ncbi:AcrR family transcriptional regulator [Hymenobacter luteus]|uniref:AcrR family transcriptional regulator n=2 Tax=Hymenobacter TaxID=89966 RepID=A0A7W9T519_9BACT|nr:MULTISPECIES: TetR/AcrR family transcriptional regulator [Hymenobacter]MBB4603082.1 AcrR family transcriptional regulator [Hymenobacter latericoloratus]MBB6060959.1 AcrR family transcriptional regulator [Hymenobacter luteus]
MLTTRKSNKRQLILEEAAKLFKQKGFGGTSMRDLAGEVGIEAASMYNHIRSKDEILELICFRVSSTYISQLAEIEATDAPYVEKIKALIRLHIRLMIEDGAAVSVANHDWKYLPEPALTEFKQARKQYEKGFAALIEQGIAAGEFQPVNVSVALFTILSAVRWVELWYRPGRELSAEELEANIITMLLTGLEKK